VEEFIVNQMAHLARRNGFSRLLGEFIPSTKNNMVKDLYAQMGFSSNSGKWELNVADCNELKTFILKK
jgi:predicted enzyme involved in methoxymalonyl-ACP biosynthesis